MKYTIESDFNKHVKSPELKRVYLLYGSQTYLIAMYEKALIKKALDGGKFDDFNFHRFQSQNLDLQAFYDAVESLPFFSQGGRCVVLDLEPDALDANQTQQLCQILADPPATTTIILTMKQSPSKKERFTAISKTCDKAGCVVELGDRRGADLLRFLRDRASKNGCELSTPVAQFLIDRCGEDMQLLSTEVDKVCAYAGGGIIRKEQVEEVVAAALHARVYDLSRAIFRGNFGKAMELIGQLEDLREPAAKVLAALSGAFVDLYRGFAARQENQSPAQAAADLGYPKNREFAIKNAMSDSGSYSAPQLGKMLEVLAQADGQLKTTGTNGRVVLEQAVTQLFLLTEKG